AINIVFFLFGVIFLRKIVGFDVVPFRSYEIRSISWIQSKLLLLIFAFCIVVLINYLRQLDRIALIVALTDGANAAKVARSVMGNSFSGKYHWYKLVIHDLGNLV
ncbi:hypothetical protein EAY16_23805, partial [Vibrio anguillarum]